MTTHTIDWPAPPAPRSVDHAVRFATALLATAPGLPKRLRQLCANAGNGIGTMRDVEYAAARTSVWFEEETRWHAETAARFVLEAACEADRYRVRGFEACALTAVYKALQVESLLAIDAKHCTQAPRRR